MDEIWKLSVIYMEKKKKILFSKCYLYNTSGEKKEKKHYKHLMVKQVEN